MRLASTNAVYHSSCWNYHRLANSNKLSGQLSSFIEIEYPLSERQWNSTFVLMHKRVQARKVDSPQLAPNIVAPSWYLQFR